VLKFGVNETVIRLLYYLIIFFGILLTQMVCAEPCHLSIREEQLSQLDQRLDDRIKNMMDMYEGLSSKAALSVSGSTSSDKAWLEADRGANVVESLNYLAVVLHNSQLLLSIRDVMVHEHDKRHLNSIVDINLKHLLQLSDRRIESLNKLLVRLQSPGVISEVTHARDVVKDLSSALRACNSPSRDQK
jgi:hypothetical protein